MVANILLVLFLLDLLVLALPFVCAHLRVHSAAPPILIALLYFVFTLTFTYLCLLYTSVLAAEFRDARNQRVQRSLPQIFDSK